MLQQMATQAKPQPIHNNPKPHNIRPYDMLIPENDK